MPFRWHGLRAVAAGAPEPGPLEGKKKKEKRKKKKEKFATTLTVSEGPLGQRTLHRSESRLCHVESFREYLSELQSYCTDVDQRTPQNTVGGVCLV
jgi:hypothetical protein